jgi:hypothetical protein
MKKNAIIILLCFLTSTSIGQTGVVAAKVMNVLYVGIDNPIEIAISEYSCDSVFIEIGNGTISGDSCLYKIKPAHVGETHVKLNYIKNGDTIYLSTKIFRVINIPRPDVWFYLHGELFDKGNPRLSKVLVPHFNNFEFELTFIVKEFSISIIRKGKEIYNEKTYGNSFSDTAIKVMNNCKPGDIISIFDVIVYNQRFDLTIEANSSELVLK